MKSVSRKLLFAGFGLLIFVILFLILYLPIRPVGNVLDSGWGSSNEDSSTLVKIPYQIPIDKITTIVLRQQINYSSGDALVLTCLKGQAVEVKLNGQTLLALGNPLKPTANIWNKTFLVPLPDPESQQNMLEIALSSASFPINISIPPYILNIDEAEWRVALIDFIYNDVLMISVGSALLIGFILIFLSIMRKKGWSAEVFLGLASILGAVETFDYQFRVSTGSLASFLLVKKILMISGYLAALAFVAGIEKYYRGKIRTSKFLAVPTIASVLAIALQRNMVNLSNQLTLLNIVLLIDLLIGVFLIIRGNRGSDSLVVPAVLLILGLLQMIAIQIFQFTWPYVMQFIILLSTIVFGMNLLFEFSQVYSEKEDLEKRIDIDTLTTAYNRNVLGKAAPNQYDVLIIMDLDNFKLYNDHHGHQEGDRILIKFAEIVKRNLREQDLVVRYGGDEFLILLSEIGIIESEQVAIRIRREFEEATTEDSLSVSYGIEKIEHSLDSDLNKADRLMYAMKAAKHLQNTNHKKHKQD